MSVNIEEKVEELISIIDKFAEDNSLIISAGKLNALNRVSLSFMEKVDTGDDDITSKDWNKFKVANERHKLNEQGIELGMIIKGLGSEKPRSKTKIVCEYKVVSGIASAKEKIIEVLRIDNGKRTKFSIADILYAIEEPADEDDAKIANGTHEFDSDGYLVEVVKETKKKGSK